MAAPLNCHRKRAEIVLPAYKHVSGRLCVYCCQSAETKDHVPAVSTAWAFGTDYFRSQGIPLLAYPSCQECNATLGAYSRRFDLKGRAADVYEKYRKKYARVMKQREWEDDELEELDYSLRSYIERFEIIRSWMERRFTFIEEMYEL